MINFFKIPAFLCMVVAGLFACNRFEDDVIPARVAGQTVLNNDVYSTVKNQPVRISVLANDTVEADGLLTFGKPAHGIIITDSAGFVYRPATSYVGTDQFYYKYCSNITCDSALVTVTVLDTVGACPINAVNDYATVPKGQQTDIHILTNDQLCGNERITLVAQPLNGSAAVTSNNVINYWAMPNSNSQTDTFSYKITTPAGISKRALVTVQITAAVCVPVGNTDWEATLVNTSVIVKPLLNDLICSGNATLSLQNQPQHGSVTLLPNNEIRYTPNPNYSGNDNFHYRFCLPNGSCSSGIVYLTVKSITNCLPNFAANTDSISFFASPSSNFNLNVLANDIYCPNQLAYVSVVHQPTGGTAFVVMFNGVPQINYIKSTAPGAPATDFLRYQVCMNVNGQNVCRTADVSLIFY